MSCYSLHRLDEWLMIQCSIKEVTSVTPGIDSPELCQNICQVLTLAIDFLVSRIHAYRFFLFPRQPGMPSCYFLWTLGLKQLCSVFLAAKQVKR